MHAPPATDGAVDLPGPLVGARWLFDHLGDLTIVDVRASSGGESGRARESDAGADPSRPASTEVS